MTRAFIFSPTAAAEHVNQCMDYCAARGYQVAGIISNADWRTAMETVTRTESVLVVARPELIDPKRKPRVEVAEPQPRAGHRRTRIIRRAG